MNEVEFTPNNDIPDIADTSNFVAEQNDAIIKVVGVGGGGCNAVNYMYTQQIPYINFVVCNTDLQALKMSPVPTKILLGPGLGAGNRPEVGRQYAEEYRDRIAELFTDKTEMVFITAGMGGGTGTGASPIVAQVAKEAGMLTVGIVTVPFLFEGKKKILKAIEGANEMKKQVDSILVINNENLVDLYEDLNVFNAFGKADDTLANAARSISEIISEPCYINVDFNDVKTTLKESGTAIIATAYGEGEHRVSQAIQNALHSPLLKSHDILTSKRLLIKFMCSRDSENAIRTKEINEITQFTNKLPGNIDVKWGIGDDPNLGDKVKVTVLASGFDVTINEDGTMVSGSSRSDEGRKGAIDMQPMGPIGGRKEETFTGTADAEIENLYGGEKIKRHNQDSYKMRYAVLTPSQFDDFEAIALLERTPAFNRPASFNEQLAKASQGQTALRQPKRTPDTPPTEDGVITF